MSFPKLLGPDTDGIFQLNLGIDQNRFDRPYLLQFLDHLDSVENNEGPTALILNSESSKFFSNGLSFEALAEDAKEFLNLFHKVLLRMLTVGVPTVAAVNGHAFAGGAMIAFCCDYRVMNQDKGYICVNEVELGFPLTPGLAAIVRAKSDRSQWVNLILRAKRFSGSEALRSNLVDAVTPSHGVREAALEIARRECAKGENKSCYRCLKEEAFAEEVSILRTSALGHADGFAERMGFKAKL